MSLSRDLLHDYQRSGVQRIIENPFHALWLDMGLGKSVTSLTAIADLSDAMEVSKVLIIAPLRVANQTWHKELLNWEHTKHLTYSICTGSEKKRLAALHKDVDVYIINRENITWLVDNYKAKWPFDMVVIDEASSFKSTKAQRWKALRKVRPYIDRLVELTGTPASNGLMDVYAQIYLLDTGDRLGRNMTAFKSRYFETDYMGYKYTLRSGAEQEIYKKLEDITMVLKSEDYLQLPDRVNVTVPVTLPPKVKKQYDELEKEFIVDVLDQELAVFNAAALANKLLQFSNGACYTDEYKNWVELHSGKIDALKDIIEDNPSENILVAYNYKTDLERLTSTFKDAVVLDKEGLAVDKWNNGEIKMLLAHPASASMGLNLQKGGSIIVWFGLTWSLELYQQFNARLHRQGQTKPVRIIHLVADGCMDEKVVKAIESKAKTQDELLDYLKQ
tara:strand:+ start:385 stop:1722 length:1338 start_codon:yes stop_codon:yes gene_type:complete